MEERAKYIPLRLTYEERKELRLVNATITVSNYTNAVDLPFKSKAKRHHAQLQAIVSFLSGTVCTVNFTLIIFRSFDSIFLLSVYLLYCALLLLKSLYVLSHVVASYLILMLLYCTKI